MVDVTNRAAGPRILWVKGEDGNPAARTLQVGQTADLDLFEPKGPVLEAWLEAGEIVLGKALPDDDDDVDGEEDEDLAGLTEDELRAYLTERGVTPGPRWGHKRLLTEATKAKAAEAQD